MSIKTSTERMVRSFSTLRQLAMSIMVMAAWVCSSQAQALTVPEGSTTAVDGGLLSLPCCDLIIEGTVTVTTGRIVARNIFITPAGSLDLGSGEIIISGQVVNEGVFSQGTGTVTYSSDTTQAKPVPISQPWMLIALACFLFAIARGYKRFLDEPTWHIATPERP